MILGGYGTFGSLIAEQLLKNRISIIINGRDKKKASAFAEQLRKDFCDGSIQIAIFDAHIMLKNALVKYRPGVVIHTCGPFQAQDSHIAEVCIKQGVHYIDLADGRGFIQNILKLDAAAKRNETKVISGASTVPALSSAVLDHYMHKIANGFVEFDSVRYGISPGQKTTRGGLATVKAVLSYIGKPIKTGANQEGIRYGWQDIYLQKYPDINNRLMGNCEIPDIDLIPEYFPVKKLHFSAGMESKFLHVLLWLTSWLVRFKLPINLPKHARFLLRASRWFDFLGTYDGGMHIHMMGTDKQGQLRDETWYIIAKNNDGPYIPSAPAVIMTKKILNGEIEKTGVFPCIGFITLEEYVSELQGLDIYEYNESKDCL